MRSRLRKAAYVVSAPLIRWILNTFELGDPWEALNVRVPFHRFGRGNRHQFSWYLEGESAVPVNTLEDINSWLATCTYESDPSLFNEEDFWQHPRTFERLRSGDCEDYALWTWRKLIELDIEARLVVGRYVGSEHGHAWVLFSKDGIECLCDPVANQAAGIAVLPLSECQNRFEPWHSVDRKFKTVSYVGYLYWWRDDLNRRKQRTRSTATTAE